MDKHIKKLESSDPISGELAGDAQARQTAGHSAQDPANTGKAGLAAQIGYQDLFDNMPNGCAYYQMLFDEAGNPVDFAYLQVNTAYEKSVGRSRCELIGSRVTGVFSGLSQASFQWVKKYIKVASFGEPAAFTQYFDQQDKWFSIVAYSPQRGYVVEILEDVTEKRRIQAKEEQYVAELAAKNRELNISHSRYQCLVDNMNNIFQYHRVIADEHGRPIDLEFAEANPAFELQSGLKIADVLGKGLPAVTHGIDKAYWVQLLGEVALTGKSVTLEKYLKNTDTWYRVFAYSPEKGYVASILEDITERKRAEAQKSENQRQVALIERVASLGALATGVAHEINQPLQALKIMADGMIYWYDKGKETSMEKVIANCRRISVQAGYITAIIERMQDFVNRAWSDTPEEVDINSMIKQAVNMVQERLKVHSIQLQENTCAVSPLVWGDIKRLEEIIIIILVNAIESLHGMDQAARKIVITTAAVGNKAVIEVSNNGPAIPDAIRGKIFDPFFSFDKSGANLGMGLAIVKSIVDAHGGTIQAANADKQVIFRIELPLYEQSAG